MLISWPTRSLDPGISPQSSKALCMSLNIVSLPTRRRRYMRPVYPHTQWNSSHFSNSMVPTLGMANYTNLLWLTHSRRLVSTGLTPLNHSRYLPTSSWPTRFQNFIGQASWNQMMTSLHFIVVRGGTVSLSFGWYNLNPLSHVNRTTSFHTNVLHSNDSPTQHSHLVHQTEF